MDKGKSRNNDRSEDEDNELDLTLRLSTLTHEEQNMEENQPTTNFHDFLGLGEDNSNKEVTTNRHSDMFARAHGSLPMGESASGLLVAPLRPIAVSTIRSSGSTLSSHDQGFLPSTGFATPSRKQPTNEDGRICRSCGGEAPMVLRPCAISVD